MNAIGYPGDRKPKGSMWQSSCRVIDPAPSDGILKYTCALGGGNSGGPTYLWYKPSRKYPDGRAIAIGVAVRGVEQPLSEDHEKKGWYSESTRLTEHRIKEIREFIEYDNTNPPR